MYKGKKKNFEFFMPKISLNWIYRDMETLAVWNDFEISNLFYLCYTQLIFKLGTLIEIMNF